MKTRGWLQPSYQPQYIPQPVIEIRGKDIAPYLYGDSLRILIPYDRNTGLGDDLLAIKRKIAALPVGSKKFGIEIRTIKSVSELHVGNHLLHLSRGSGDALLKSISQITRLAMKDYPHPHGTVEKMLYVHMKALFPETSRGFEGFFPAVSVLSEDTLDFHDNGVYFHYFPVGTKERQREEEEGKSRPKSFFERMHNHAGELRILISCWAIAHNPDMLKKGYWSYDPFESYWRNEFAKRYGRRFQHERVWDQLQNVLEGELRGINKIYDDTTWRMDRTDLVTPLLHQMQTDILERLFEDESLVEILFRDDDPEYIKRCLKTVFEQYYGPKSVAYVGHRKEYHHGEKSSNLTYATVKKLRAIEVLIKRGATEGEREAAREAYQRVAGHAYQG